MKNQSPFPGVADRFKAMFIDSFVLIGFAIAFTFIFSSIGDVSDTARILAFVFLVALYDPLLTSFLGGTIGHFVMGLRVRRMNDYSKKIILPMAFIRYLVKASLGWISLLTVGGNFEHRAIHDFVGNSIVVYEKQSLNFGFEQAQDSKENE
jgi:uncharacterized RDD family membrane protein YckC